jgi:sortase A
MGQAHLKIFLYLSLAAGLLLICDGMWLRLKEVLAQKLLHNAWQETVRTGVSVKPWPWADSWPVARLRVDRLGVDHIVLEGDSGEALAFGPGRVTAGVRPGQDGNCILAGHRDTSFTFLQELIPGDRIRLQAVTGREYVFQVTSSSVEERAGLYFEQPETPWLTMVTCYPFEGVRPSTEQRYVVFAKGAFSS